MNRALYARPKRGRECARCGLPRPLKAFRRDPRLQDGLASWCRDCYVAATREWRAKNRVAINRRKRADYRQNREQINARRRVLYASRKRSSASARRPREISRGGTS